MAKDEMNENKVIDAAVMQKLLPKLHGSRNKIEKILVTLGKLCIDDSSEEPFSEATTNIKYPLSHEKLKRMHMRVLSDGFTSFAEA
jgi:5-methylcytosine-specific restriction protein B